MHKKKITIFYTIWMLVFSTVLFQSGCKPTDNTCAEVLSSGLIGYWKLAGDFKDYSGNGNHGCNFGVDFSGKGRDGKTGTAANFNGINSYIEVADNQALNLGSGDFSISVWVYTDKNLRDTLGDIVSKYDPQKRKGFNFIIMNYAGVTSSQSNYRNVLLGIDNGRIDLQWTDCGRPGNAVMPFALTVYEGGLYAGTFEWGANESGHVYRYAGGRKWVDCGSPYECTSVAAMAVYDSKLYAGVSRYSGSGSLLAAGPSPNKVPGGKVYRYEGGTKWTYCGKLSNPQTGEADSVSGLTVFDGRLYAVPGYRTGRGLYRYEGGQTWTYCGTLGDDRINRISVFNGNLYGGSNDGGRGACRYDGDKNFEWCGNPKGAHQTYSFMAYQGEMYVGTWPKAEVFRYNGLKEWINCGRLGSEKEVMGMVVYNGKLYAGTLPLAKVYRYESGTEWADTGRLDMTPDEKLHKIYKYRRAWTMAVYNGKLFCSTLPSGLVKSIEAGKSVTYDYELAPGWRHLVGVRSGNKLKLYIEGKLATSSSEFNPADYDISNDKPFKIGFGQHDYFNGRISELRVYNRALTAKEIEALYQMK